MPKLPAKDKVVEALNFHAFEAALAGGDTIEIGVPANRYSDAASHRGVAVILSAILNKPLGFKPAKELKLEIKKPAPRVSVISKKHSPKYLARYFEIVKMKPTPQWAKDILMACGQKPINAVVDAMNLAMLETGQPLHAFDAGLIAGGLQVRLAKNGEEIKTIDSQNFTLRDSDLVIADDEGLLAIAGVKGGKRAEIGLNTRSIIVEAANFDGSGVYKTARAINLFTDASSRFSHGLSPVLAERGMNRAAELLKEFTGVKTGAMTALSSVKPNKTTLKFDIAHFIRLTGLSLKEKDALGYLKKLGFGIKGKLVTAPDERTDIGTAEDLFEEIVNLYGYDKLPAVAPKIGLSAAGKEDAVVFKDLLRSLLIGFGFNETYNYSFVGRKELTRYADPKWWGAVSLRNPISSDFQYLRPSLALGLLKNLDDNLRFFDEARLFEIGKTFVEEDGSLREELRLDLAIGFKKGNPALELKGAVDEAVSKLGLTDYFFRDLNMEVKYLEPEHSVRLEVGHSVVGLVGVVKGNPRYALASFDLGKLMAAVSGEKEYRPLPKYPAISRDLSLVVDSSTRVGGMQDVLENASPLIFDVDLLDWYEDEKIGDGKKSITFRIVFQSEDRTLTDIEVNKEMEKVLEALQSSFDVEVR